MKTPYIAVLLASALSFAASAQDLVKEIDVDRTIVPEEREAMRPAAPSPQIFTPKVKRVALSAADRLLPSTLTTLVAVPAAATWGSTQPLTPYRGYLEGGYFPVYNLGVRAGYQLVSTTASQLGAWVGYAGDSYKYDDEKYNNHFLSLGLGGSHSFNDHAALRATVTYRHDAFSTPFVGDGKQGTSILDFRGTFLGKTPAVGYAVNADVLHFAFSDPLSSVAPVEGKAMKQTQIKAGGDVTFSIPAVATLRPGASVSFDALLTDNNPTPTAAGLRVKNATFGILRLDPYALFTAGEVEGKVGVNLSFGLGDQDAVHLAPNVSVAYAPRAYAFDLWVSATGGMDQNRIYDLYERDYTCTPPFALKSYNIPVALRAGLNVGPFAGVRASVHAGYAITRDMAIPWLDTPVAPGMTTERKLDGLNGGVELSYTHALFGLRAGYEASTSSKTDPAKGWYLWRDRARSAVTASLDVRPIAKLTVTLSYLGRYGRHTFAPSVDTSRPWLKVSTRDISNLNLSAKYAFTPAISFFARIDNLLNHRYLFSSTVPAPGLTGQLGASLKF